MEIVYLGTEAGTLSSNLNLFKYRTHKRIQFVEYKSKSNLEHRGNYKTTALWFYLNFKGLGFLVNTVFNILKTL